MPYANSAAVAGFWITATASADISVTNKTVSKIVIHNREGILYVKLGPGASASNFTYRLNKNAVAEIDGYYGEITAIKSANSSYVDVTEYL